jgi:hypothetical protein
MVAAAWLGHMNIEYQPKSTSGTFFYIDGLEPILDQVDNNTYILLNISNVVDKPISVPLGKKLYIFSWAVDPFEYNWFTTIYNANPDSHFIVLYEGRPGALSELDRVTHIGLYFSKGWIQAIKHHGLRQCTPTHEKDLKISCMSSRINEYKYYVTAKLLTKPGETLVKWNMMFPIRDTDRYIYEETGRLLRDLLLYQFKSVLEHPVNAEEFENSPLANSLIDYPAYTRCLINSINETCSVSWDSNFGDIPGPFITEKTWKNLASGTALLFSGQHGIADHLTKFGFKFDYPWSNKYDSVVGDLDRLELLLETCDKIFDLDIQSIRIGIQKSIEHNYQLFWSGSVEQQIDTMNQELLNKLQVEITKHAN